MANYPSFELVGNEKNYLDNVWDTKMWDVSQMPGKLYLHTGNGRLVAIKPKFFVEVQANTEHVYGTRCIFGFEMAGEGLTVIRVNTYNGPSILFASPEDFENYQTTGRGAYQIPLSSPSEILRSAGYDWDRGCLKLWFADKGLPSYRYWYFKYRVWIDRDGAHAEHLQDQSYGTLYKNREECAAALPKAQVVDFDEPAPASGGIMDTTNGHEPELVRRINDAWDKYREEFRPILIALYDRDIEEIFNSDAFRCGWNDTDEAFADLQSNWDMHAWNYLQHIADNQDLSAVLHFLNYGNRK